MKAKFDYYKITCPFCKHESIFFELRRKVPWYATFEYEIQANIFCSNCDNNYLIWFIGDNIYYHFVVCGHKCKLNKKNKKFLDN